ncbi:MAG: 23S rRNA (pseudouridine(1915)-N(3))-methyltransferase RlmH [Clostridiales bacterium]|jgi:23S rRNA (pseudouridine1915-N3)-methyltransferase|nr:23S rRNA (pseudouridine(1915)-N(3))-methyltransferase RlmH [Clostridiales bacterium]
MIFNIIVPKEKPRSFYNEAAEEYEKRLSRFCRISRVTKPRIKTDADYYIKLSSDGTVISSEDFAQKIQNFERRGADIRRVVFFTDFCDLIKRQQTYNLNFDESLLLSVIPLSHDAQIVLLLEQIYRAYKIIHNQSYHK